MNILIVSPHPDDLEIFMGGTASKLVDEGNHVRSVIITDGRKSPRLFECSDDEMAEIRKNEGIKAHKILGISDFEYFGLENAKDEDKVEEILFNELMKKFDRIYIPDLEDFHPTHKEISGIIIKILKANNIIAEVFTYDGWNFLHQPLFFEDIEKYIDKKIQAIRAHESQVKDKPYDEAMEKFARVRAILMDPHKITNIKSAEAFKRIKVGGENENV